MTPIGRNPERGERLFWPLFVLALLGALVPIWTVEDLPLGDYGAHLEQMDIMARHDDPSTVYAEVYALPDTPIHPNSVSLLAGWLMGPALGAETVGRLLLSWYVVGFPLGVLALCGAFRRSRWLAFFGVPLAFNAQLNMGFLNMLVAWPLLLGAIALARVFAERGGRRWGAALAATLVATFFAHILAYLMALGLVVALLLLLTRRARDLWRLSVVVPALPLLADWVRRMIVTPEATAVGRRFASEGGLGLGYASFGQWVRCFEACGFRFFRDASDNVAGGVLIALWVALVALGWRATRAPAAPAAGGALAWARRHSLEVLTACCFAAYAVLPSRLSEVDVVGERTVVLLLVLGALWPRVQPSGRAARLALGALVAAALAYPPVVRAEFAEYDASCVGDLREAVAALPDRSALAFVEREFSNPITYQGPTRHLAKAFQALENGGTTEDTFAQRPSSPIQVRSGHTPRPVGLGVLGDPALADYRAILLRARDEPTDLLDQPTLHLRWHQGWWWLFDVVPGPPAASSSD